MAINPCVEVSFVETPALVYDKVAKQIQEIEMLISEPLSGLVVFSSDARAIAPTINRAVDRGIPVVTAFADVPNSRRLAHVGTDQVRLARKIANRALRDFSQNKSSDQTRKALILIGKNSSTDQVERKKGIEDIVSKRMEVFIEEDNFKAGIAEEHVYTYCKRDASIRFIFGCNSQSAIGTVNALDRLGRDPGEIAVTGWDADKEVINNIAPRSDGPSWIHATAVLYAGYMIQVCFALLEAVKFGYLYSDAFNTEELKLPAVPQLITIPTKEVVTSANVDEYLGKSIDIQPC
jgi:ABC-type sugar transport system substrate-binding protein